MNICCLRRRRFKAGALGFPYQMAMEKAPIKAQI